MAQVHCPTRESGETTAHVEGRSIPGGLDAHALRTLSPDEADATRVHLRAHGKSREEHDSLAAVAPHLYLLREALTYGRGRNPLRSPAGLTESGHVTVRRHRKSRAAAAKQITLSQWVSSTTSVIRGTDLAEATTGPGRTAERASF